MPIYEYQCNLCGHTIEKVTTTVPVSIPQAIKNWCEDCEADTRHDITISKPAVVAHKPGSNPAFKMRDVRPAKDKSWKKRILEGKAPDGRPLTNRLEKSKADWGMLEAVRAKDVYSKG